jgi:hypothetical protein
METGWTLQLLNREVMIAKAKQRRDSGAWKR